MTIDGELFNALHNAAAEGKSSRRRRRREKENS
jgi:hypothetical protein